MAVKMLIGRLMWESVLDSPVGLVSSRVLERVRGQSLSQGDTMRGTWCHRQL